jgi:lipopolysaccharide biosynthesis glycosyltransferase
MSAKKNLILYQANGVRYINQALYSIASLINVYNGKVPANIHVLVYTDDVDAFNSVKATFANFECILLTKEKSLEWAGPSNYIFRFKPKLIEDALNRYDGSALYLDTDTAFIKKVDSLFKSLESGNLILHTREWQLAHGMKQWGLVVIPEPRSVTLPTGHEISITHNTYMWNAGAVGVSGRNALFVDEVISVLDVLIADGPHYLSEQLTWSVMFSQRGNLQEARNQVYHYWDNKEALDQYITESLAKVDNDFMKFLPLVNPSMFLNEPLKQKVIKKLKGLVSGILRK